MITLPRMALPMAFCSAPTSTTSRSSRSGRSSGSSTMARSTRWRKNQSFRVGGQVEPRRVVGGEHRPCQPGHQGQEPCDESVRLGEDLDAVRGQEQGGDGGQGPLGAMFPPVEAVLRIHVRKCATPVAISELS